MPILVSGWTILLWSAFLVSVPVFAQAPLVRSAPWVSLAATLGWLAGSLYLMSQPKWQIYGSLLYGFSLTWLAGSLYWGWLRTEPLWHMPVEAIALPLAVWGLWRGFARVGNYFFLGSLFGTAITDLYIHTVGLLPHWRGVMLAQMHDLPIDAAVTLNSALVQMQSLRSLICAILLGCLLLSVGLMGLHYASVSPSRRSLYWWAFSGAVLSTLLVDGLFGWGAMTVGTAVL